MTPRPNMVWIMCDQMRFDAAGFAGSDIVQTPRLDALAASGAVFENAYCASPVCSPARASWLTGLYPHAHGQLRNYGPIRGRTYGSHLPPNAVTIGDRLADAGYRCGMVGCWHLGDDHLPQHGFTDLWMPYRYLGPDHEDPLEAYLAREGVANLYNDPGALTQYGNTLGFGTIDDPRQQRTTWTIDHAIDFVRRPSDDPFFLFASVKDPHPKMLVPPALLDLYPPDRIPLPTTLRDPLDGKPAYHATTKFRIPPDVTDDQIREMIAYYYALVTHIDTQVGRLLDALRAAGTLDDTIVVFMSDHGELLGDHGCTEKCLMYESSVRVPMVVAWPNGIPGGQRIHAPLGGVDLAPTLLQLAGAAALETIDGRSVSEALRNAEEPASRPIFAEIAGQQAIYQRSETPEHFSAHAMVIDGGWKYVWNRFDIDELYDLESDPEEVDNRAKDAGMADRAGEMRGLIGEMVGRTGPGPYGWCVE